MKRIAVVGTGGRCLAMFIQGLAHMRGKEIEFVGLYDRNRTRCEYVCAQAGGNIPIFSDFDEMLSATKADSVLVTTSDDAHAEYVIRALRFGAEVYCEKPLTNTYENCLAIRNAEKETGKRVHVTFNCRFMPYFARLKSLIAEGAIGKIHSITYEYTLNRHHGGDYLKRWHGHMAISQGMLLHKSTHHFDVINWLLEDEPVRVSAMATRSFFGNEAKRLGERCSTCPAVATCESHRSITAAHDEGLYFKAEHEDGYLRDRCAHREGTDIADNLSVSVFYKKGTLLTYTLNLFSMKEGYHLTLVGERGMIVCHHYPGEGVHDGICEIELMQSEGKVEKITFPEATGVHGGGDAKLLEMMFSEKEIPDPLGQSADSFAGVLSAMIGIGANESIKSGKHIDLVPLIDSLR